MTLKCSEMVNAEINQKQERQNELSNLITTRKAEFDNEKDVEKRDALMNEVDTAKKEYDALNADIETLVAQRDKLSEQEKRMGLIGNVTTVKVTERQKDIYSTTEYRDAYIDWIKYQKVAPILKREDTPGLSTTTASPVVPTVLQNYIETSWSKYGNIANLCDVISVKGYYSVPVEKTATGATVHAEGTAAPSEEVITMDSIVLQPVMIKKWISLTDEVMALTGDEFMKYVADEIVYQIYKKLDEQIISGTLTGTKGIKGILNDTNASSVTSTLTFNAINTALAELNQFDNLTVVMNPKTFFKNVLGLADTAGRPIYTVASDNTGKPKYFISGIPVEFSDAIKDYDTALSTKSTAWAIVGDFKAYKLNLPMGKIPQLLYDPYTSATADKEQVVGKLLAAGAITKMKRLAKLVSPAA